MVELKRQEEWDNDRTAGLRREATARAQRAASKVQEFRDSDRGQRAASKLSDLRTSEPAKRAEAAFNDLRTSDAGKKAESALADLRQREPLKKAEEAPQGHARPVQRQRQLRQLKHYRGR